MTTPSEYRKQIEAENGELTEDQWETLIGLAQDNAKDLWFDEKSDENFDSYFEGSLAAHVWDSPL